MTKRPANRFIGRMSSLRTLFARNRSGMAAVEFGLLVPILFIMFIGTLELGQAIGLDRRVSMVTASTADLIAREEEMDDARLDGIMQIVGHLLSPYDANSLQLGVISVKADSANPATTRVEWSYSHNGATVPTQCSTYSMPSGLLAPGASAIIVETRFDYEPLLVSHYLNSAVTLEDKATVSPRHSCVDYNDTNCILTCP